MNTRPKPTASDDAPIKRKRPETLTQREQEILQLIWSGLKNKEIAQRLKISVKTVEAHRANMMKKFACRMPHNCSTRPSRKGSFRSNKYSARHLPLVHPLPGCFKDCHRHRYRYIQ